MQTLTKKFEQEQSRLLKMYDTLKHVGSTEHLQTVLKEADDAQQSKNPMKMLAALFKMREIV